LLVELDDMGMAKVICKETLRRREIVACQQPRQISANLHPGMSRSGPDPVR
jgi:hypothetical protein